VLIKRIPSEQGTYRRRASYKVAYNDDGGMKH
jgi:hypothetical protein